MIHLSHAGKGPHTYTRYPPTILPKHTSIKLENVLRGPGGRVLLSDFGFAINAREERPVTRLGTFGSMSKEVLNAFVKTLPDEYKDRIDASYGAEAGGGHICLLICLYLVPLLFVTQILTTLPHSLPIHTYTHRCVRVRRAKL